jgi:hypothetical protein
MRDMVAVSAFAEFSASRLQGRILPGSTRAVPKTGDSARVIDSPSVFTIDGVTSSDDCVLVVSNARFPDFAGNAAERSATAKALAGERLGKHICSALDWGYLDGVSFAVYPRLVGFSRHKVVNRLQAMQSRSAILAWLGELQSRTSREIDRASDIDRHFLTPMQRLVADKDLDPRLRAAVALCVKDVKNGRRRTALCLEHGDFWIGNVMLEPREGWAGSLPAGRFQIIDWAGSKPEGHHASDALRFALSAFGAGKRSARLMRAYCRATALAPQDVPVHVFSSMGTLHANLNAFPKERFNMLAARLFGFLDGHGFLDGVGEEGRVRAAGSAGRAALGSRI